MKPAGPGQDDVANDVTMPTAIDLFAGCGGLSLGLRRAGWRVLTAIENSELAAESYYRNLLDKPEAGRARYERHLQLDFKEQLQNGLYVGDVRVAVERSGLLRDVLENRELGLLAGGPPCQGFSLAGRRRIDDPRNNLVWSFLDVAALLKPRFVLMENVGAIQSPFDRDGQGGVLGDLEKALSGTASEFGGYSTIRARLRSDRFGVPQRRLRVFLIGVRKDLADKLSMPPWAIWDSEEVERAEGSGLPEGLESPSASLSAGDALWDIIGQHYLPLSVGPSSRAREYARCMRSGDSREFTRAKRLAGRRPANHDYRNHNDRTQTRFQLMRSFRDAAIPEDLFYRVGRGELAIGDELLPLETTFPIELPNRTIDNLADLVLVVRSLGTRKHTQRALDENVPAPTITTLPDDLCHYGANRTLTVREMARLQTFPDSFVFFGKVTTGGESRRTQVPQYSQVGNAVPPRLACALGTYLLGKDQTLRSRPCSWHHVNCTC